jgi:hypothetical protein
VSERPATGSAGAWRAGGGSAAAAALLGFAGWAASPALTGHVEPWDAELPFYSATTIVGGLVLGLASRRFAALYAGAWLGQVLAVLLLPGRDASGWPVALVSTGAGSLLVLVGAGLGASLRRAVRRLRER